FIRSRPRNGACTGSSTGTPPGGSSMSASMSDRRAGARLQHGGAPECSARPLVAAAFLLKIGEIGPNPPPPVSHAEVRVTDPLGLTYPFTGPWLTQNSPASRVPSHGTTRFATAQAIDFVPVDDQGRSAPLTVTSLLHAEPAARFPGFGRPVLAPIAGTVVAVHDGEEDHDAYRGFPSLGYAWTQRRRLAAGWVALAGNHVMLRTEAGPVVVLCHLQQHSILVASGQRVRSGDLLGRCGNSGNSTEPHLHLQVIDQPRVHEAAAVPFV